MVDWASIGKSFKNATVGTVSSIDALPKDGVIDIDSAYVMQLIISDEGTASGFKMAEFNNRPYNGMVIIKAFCPEKLQLNFVNDFDTIDPMSMASSSLVNGAVQLFTGHSTKHRINNIQVWKGAKPLSLTVKFELYATRPSTGNNLLTGNTTLQSGGLSSNDLLFLLQQLTALAQPRVDKGNRLIPPGPSPLIASFKGYGFKAKENDEGQITGYEVLKQKGTEKDLEVITNTRTGTRVDIKFGNFLTLSHVIVKSVNVEIPYVMAESAKYSGKGDNIKSIDKTTRAKPVMASVTMNIETKTMVDQETFAKMINNVEQSNPAEIDLTGEDIFSKVFSKGLAVASAFTNTGAVQEDGNTSNSSDKK